MAKLEEKRILNLDMNQNAIKLNSGKGRYGEEFIEMNLIASRNYGIVCKAMNKKNKEIFVMKKISIEKRFKEKALKEIKIYQNSKVNSLLDSIPRGLKTTILM